MHNKLRMADNIKIMKNKIIIESQYKTIIKDKKQKLS